MKSNFCKHANHRVERNKGVGLYVKQKNSPKSIFHSNKRTSSISFIWNHPVH